MDKLIEFIISGGTTALTPEVLIRYMVFVLIVSAICNIANSVMKVGDVR